VTAAERNERRRLQSILDDERYGPALVRLTRSEQRDVLRLVEGGDGRAARAEIARLDVARKGRRREASAKRPVVPWGAARAVIGAAVQTRQAEGDWRWGARTVDTWQARARAHKASVVDVAMVAALTPSELRGRAWEHRFDEYSIFWYH